MARRKDTEMIAAIDGEGRVLVEGEYVGELSGFSFVPDAEAESDEQKSLRAAARKVLAREMTDRAGKFTQAKDEEFSLQSGSGTRSALIVWDAQPLVVPGRGPGSRRASARVGRWCSDAASAPKETRRTA